MNDRLATARWEDPSDVAAKHRYDTENFWLGRTAEGVPIGYADDRHVCLVSGTRGGKGTSIIVNNLAYWPGSAVVIDPKGENATVTAARRGHGDDYCTGMYQAVHVLDPFGAATIDDTYRSCFNPLDALDPHREETIDEASRLASAIIVTKEEKAEQYWDEAARTLLRSVILHVVSSDDFMPSEKTLLTVQALLKRGDWQSYEAMKDDRQTEIEPPHILLLQSMELNPAFGGVIAADGSRHLSMIDKSPKTFESVLQTVLNELEFLNSPGLRRVLASSDFSLAELKTNPDGMTLYLCLPQRFMQEHYRWLRMMVTLITAQMEITRGQPATGHRVLMLLDEFAGLKRMTAIENAVAQIAGFGVKLMFVLQSLEQLKAVYKDGWETFLSNAGLKIFFSIEDNFTREYVSKQIGDTELVRVTHSANAGGSDNQSQATGTSHSTGISSSHGGSASTAFGSSSSDARGSNSSTAQGISSSNARGSNQSDTFGDSETFNSGWNSGHSTSHSVGNSSSAGTSFSDGSSASYSCLLPGIPMNITHSLSSGVTTGASSSDTQTDGYSYGSSGGTSEGHSSSRSKGSSLTRTDGTSFTRTDGNSLTRTDGTSATRTNGASWTDGSSRTDGSSETTTRGSGSSWGESASETIHRRPLVRPEEIGKLFARINDPEDPLFPGLALVLTTGGDPFMVRRTNYFQDPQFIDCFSPHPDHRFIAAETYNAADFRPLLNELGGTLVSPSYWQVFEQDEVRPGQTLFTLTNTPPDGKTLTVCAPCFGKLVERAQDLFFPDLKAESLFTIRYYPGQEIADPFLELRQAVLLPPKKKAALNSPPSALPKLTLPDLTLPNPSLADRTPPDGLLLPKAGTTFDEMLKADEERLKARLAWILRKEK